MVLPVNVVKGNFLQSTNHNKFRASFFSEKARVLFITSQIKEKRQFIDGTVARETQENQQKP